MFIEIEKQKPKTGLFLPRLYSINVGLSVEGTRCTCAICAHSAHQNQQANL
jgi:hypothetical protein